MYQYCCQDNTVVLWRQTEEAAATAMVYLLFGNMAVKR